MSVIDGLLDNNNRYAASFPGSLPSVPAAHLAVVACMDARLNVYATLGLREGEAHVIRNAGGVITDDAIRSLSISQRLLDTTQIVLIHHTRCGMLTFTDDQFKAAIEADTGIRPPWAAEAFGDLDADVRQSIARIKASPFVPHKNQVRGFVFDVDTGLLREVACAALPARSSLRPLQTRAAGPDHPGTGRASPSGRSPGRPAAKAARGRKPSRAMGIFIRSPQRMRLSSMCRFLDRWRMDRDFRSG